MTPKGESQGTRAGRWIKPAGEAVRSAGARIAAGADVSSLAEQLLRETRKKVTDLAALERELEDRITKRWEEAEAEARRKLAMTEEEIQASRRRADTELKDLRGRAEKEGRAAGFRDGFARGREEGYRLGFEEGRREGQKDGQREGKDEAVRRMQGELSGAAAALSKAVLEFQEKQEKLLDQARKELLALSLEIAKKIIKKELQQPGDCIVRNVEKAIELIFRRGALVIHVHPDDAPVVERTLAAEPRWAEGFDSIEVRAAPEVERGGCRIVSGAGAVDMTIQTQLSLIEAALENSGVELGSPDPSAEVHPASKAGKEGLES